MCGQRDRVTWTHKIGLKVIWSPHWYIYSIIRDWIRKKHLPTIFVVEFGIRKVKKVEILEEGQIGWRRNYKPRF